MELISNLLQFFVALFGFCLSGICYLKDRVQAYFLLACFYGCFFSSDSIFSPYCWCDFLLTGCLLGLLPAMRKAVKA